MQRDVLFIHGWWAAGWVWSRVADRFESAGFRTHALTLAGPETGRASFAENLEDALEVARSIGNPILVGHSVGGLLAMKMTETLTPPACIAITPASPAGIVPRPSVLLIHFLIAALPSILLGRTFLPHALLRRIDLNLLPAAEQDDVLAQMRPVSASQVRRIVPALVRLDRRQMRSRLLVVGAARDLLTPVAQTRAIARRYGADYREYADAAHYILREPAWSDMTSDLIAWIVETVPEAPSPTSTGESVPG